MSLTIRIPIMRVLVFVKCSVNDLAYSLLTEFNGKANSSSLKALAYLDKVEQAQLGATIISGGHIITSLIDTDAIYANMASIAGFTIEKNQLYGTTNNEYYGSYKMYMDSSRCEIGISDSNESTYKLSVGYNYRTTNDAGTASLFIKKSLAIRTMVEVPRTAIKVAVTNADDSNMVKLECESTRNDSGFMNFLYCEHGIREIQLGTKKFSNDSPGIWRTVLRMDLMPSVTQVNTESTSGTRYNVKWDSATGLLYIE